MRLFKIAAATVVVAGVLTGVGYAAGPSDGVVSTCVDNSTGNVRVVTPSDIHRDCTPSEHPLALNQTGPAGPVGPAGAVGATGAQGPAGPSFVWSKSRSSYSPGTSYQYAARILVPKGLYQVTGKGYAYMTEALGHEYWAAVTCALRVRHASGTWETLDVAVTEVSDGGPEYGAFSLQGLLHVDGEAEGARLDCKDDGGLGGGLVTLKHLRLHVQQVGGYLSTAG